MNPVEKTPSREVRKFLRSANRLDDSHSPGIWPGEEPDKRRDRTTPRGSHGVLTTVLFIVMVAGWSNVVLNYTIQDLTGERSRGDGVRAAVVGAVAAVLFTIALGTAWFRALQAVVADRSEPAEGGAARRERDQRRARGRSAGAWAAAAALAGLLLAVPLGQALRDLQLPDELWPRDPLKRFDVVADDAEVEAAELDGVLSNTADKIDTPIATERGASQLECRLPDGSVGIYYTLGMRRHVGAVEDPMATVESAAEYWRGMGYSLDAMSERPSDAGGAIISQSAHTTSGGLIYILATSDSTTLDGHSGCSPVGNGAP